MRLRGDFSDTEFLLVHSVQGTLIWGNQPEIISEITNTGLSHLNHRSSIFKRTPETPTTTPTITQI